MSENDKYACPRCGPLNPELVKEITLHIAGNQMYLHGNKVCARSGLAAMMANLILACAADQERFPELSFELLYNTVYPIAKELAQEVSPPLNLSHAFRRN